MASDWQAPLVGRSTLISGILEGLIAGEGGQILQGASGIGKSRLLKELVEAATAAGVPSVLLVATQSLARVPLGIFVGLLPMDLSSAPVQEPSPLIFVANAVRAQIARDGIRLIAVDDAHLIDAASAGILHQLALSGVSVCATVASGEGLQDAVNALWKSGVSPLVDVPPLTEPQTVELLRYQLKAPVDRRLGNAIFIKTGGNPQLIAEVTESAVRAGAIAVRSGISVMTRPLPLDADLRRFLRARVGALSDRVRSAAEVVAVGEPLDVEVLIELLPVAALDEAESAGVVVRNARTGILRLAPPLEADAIFGSLTDRRRRHWSRELISVLGARSASMGASTISERALLARLRLELGDDVEATELVAVAEQLQTTNPGLCTHFLREALRRDGTVDVRIRIARVLALRDRLREATRLLDSLDEDLLSPQHKVDVLAIRAHLLAMTANRPGRALEILDAGITELGPVPTLLAVRSTALWRLGRVTGAVTASLPIVEDASATAGAAAQAAITAYGALIHTADTEGLAAVRENLDPLVTASGELFPRAAVSTVLADHYVSLFLRDDLEGTRGRAQRAYSDALRRGDDGVRAQHALSLGWIAVLRGQVGDGLSYLAEALSARGAWAPTTLPWGRSLYVQALVLSGDVDAAAQILARIKSSPRAPIYDIDVALAEASVSAAGGDLASAARTVSIAANRAHALGQNLLAGIAWYAATRYGDLDAAERFLSRNALRTPANHARRLHAAALIRSDAAGVEEAATAFEQQQLMWFAVEAQSHAVALHRSAGASYRASAAATRLASMLESVPLLRSPVVNALPHTSALTSREFEIAQLASSGITDRSIAVTLGISVRTVQTHLGRVYNKLGARSRSELRAWLPAQRVESSPSDKRRIGSAAAVNRAESPNPAETTKAS
jgi:DNA-binding CsgD family transcriptional regulator